jgi:hypothetical protein
MRTRMKRMMTKSDGKLVTVPTVHDGILEVLHISVLIGLSEG